MPSPTFIGRSAEDLNITATSAGTAATGAEDTRDATTRASKATRDEIDDATVKLQQHFDRIATEFRAQITQFSTTVNTSDWEGRAKQSAVDLAQRMTTSLDTLVAATTERISGFKTWMLTSADAFNDDVSVHLGTLLQGFGEQYSGLSRVITDFNAQMEDVETSGATSFA